MSNLDPQEKDYYDRLFQVIDKHDAGVLPGQDALPFLISSSLSQQVLGEVWAVADADNNGFLTREGWYKAARLIGWLQNGETTVTETLTTKRPPYPKFAGQTPPVSTSTRLPPVTAVDRTKFTRIFVGCGPSNGLVSGDKARDVFVKSKLDYEKLGQIWNLADTQQRGSLDLTDFIIGMYLIQSCMADPSLNLPSTLPPGTYEQASGGRTQQVAPMSPQRTGSSLRPQHTGPISPINPQRTGTPTRASSVLTSFPAWDVTSEAKATSDRFFAQLDTQNKGVIEGDVAVPFMLQSQLDEATLATIWDLADIKHEGKLDRDQFAVAMHLINGKLAGNDVPKTLPMSLIPPSLRQTAGPQEVLSGPSSATRDLFDLFDDPPSATPAFSPAPPPANFAPSPTPPPSVFTSQPPVPSRSVVRSPLPPSDLLGEEAAPVSDHSAEIGNKRNEVESTERNLAAISSTRQQLETASSDSAAELADLQQRLSTAREKHESETKAVTDLNQRVSEQKTTLQKLNSELISAESDVSALKSEKDELEQALLHDKEEVRDLQRRMKDLDDERITLKTVLEKLRKEARQQKGLVTIAKKQLSTAESARDGVQTEIDTETTAAAAVPLPATPQALSPVPTGLSQRSNNPFDRLGRTSQPSTVALLGAGAVATAGVVVAGAETLFHAAKEVVSPPVAEEKNVDDAENSQAPATAPELDPFEAPVHEQADSQARKDEESADAFGAGTSTEAEPGSLGFGDSFTLAQDDSPVHESANAPPAVIGTSQSDFDAAFVNLERETQAGSAIHSNIDQPTDAASSDEEEGPEEIDAPRKYRATSPPPPTRDTPSVLPIVSIPTASRTVSPSLAPPVETQATITPRRSAPPPPVRNTSTNVDALDPFAPSSPQRITQTMSPQSMDAPLPAASPVVVTGIATTKAPTSEPAPTEARVAFDDDDFDLSDLPAATVDHTVNHPSASGPNFDDEFAGFDDEFGSTQPPSGSDNSVLAKSYEMVSPGPRDYDEWAVPGASTVQPPGQSSLSFDDAFGGDFEPSVPGPAQAVSSAALRSPSSVAPPLPQRSETQPQNDDIEDVKKLCAMGFPRDLAIAALDANGYDFQKSLNVLLAQ